MNPFLCLSVLRCAVLCRSALRCAVPWTACRYSKIKKVQWKADAEKLGADTYYLKYSFPTKADLEDFQAW